MPASMPASARTPRAVTAVPSTPDAESLFNNYVNDVYKATKQSESHANDKKDDDHRTIELSSVIAVSPKSVSAVMVPNTPGFKQKEPRSTSNQHTKTPGSIQREPRSTSNQHTKTPVSIQREPRSTSNQHTQTPVSVVHKTPKSSVPKSYDHRLPDLSNQAMMRTPSSTKKI
jgi:hypothetical protein